MSAGERIARKALAAITKYGVSLTLSRPAGGRYDAERSEVQASAPTNISVRGIVEQQGTSQTNKADSSFADDSNVRAHRRKVTLAASGLAMVPQAGDTIGTIDGRTWRVEGVNTVQMSDVPVLYECRVSS